MIASALYKLTLEFDEPILGTQPGGDTPASDYLRDRAVKDSKGQVTPEMLEEESETLDEQVVKGTTIFHKDGDGNPLFYGYHVKGMIKEAGKWLNGTGGVKNLRAKLDKVIEVSPRRIPIQGEMDEPFERPLRAETMKGPRTSLARSERIKAGAKLECKLRVYDLPNVHITETILRELMDYASAMLGMGQWRNSGIYGHFSYTLECVSALPKAKKEAA